MHTTANTTNTALHRHPPPPPRNLRLHESAVSQSYIPGSGRQVPYMYTYAICMRVHIHTTLLLLLLLLFVWVYTYICMGVHIRYICACRLAVLHSRERTPGAVLLLNLLLFL